MKKTHGKLGLVEQERTSVWAVCGYGAKEKRKEAEVVKGKERETKETYINKLGER